MSGAPVSPVPAPQPGSSTTRLVVIVLCVIFGIGLLTVAGLVVAGYVFASRVSVSTVRDEQGREKTVKIDTPLGRLRVEKQRDIDPKLLGVPIYPGATVLKDDVGARVDLDLDFADKSVRVLVVKMETEDPFQKVVDFYRDEAADFVFVEKKNGGAEFRWEHGKLKKIVAVSERRGKTRISLANIGEPEAN